MKKVMKLKMIAVVFASLLVSSTFGQTQKMIGDSLAGFEENAAKKAALSEGFYGSEFPVRMASLKRDYINAKYGIKVKKSPAFSLPINYGKTAAPACNNEDFEASAAGNITTSNQITGWTVEGGTNMNPNNSCNLLGCCPNAPTQGALITAGATGYVDPVIGAQYPIYSVFGTVANNGLPFNPQIGLPAMNGNNFIRLNNATSNFSMEKLTKTFLVTPSNALFQFAFISVFYPGHGCCDAGAFQIKLTNASTNSVLACPAFSVSALSTQCTGTTPVTYYIGGTNNPNTPSNFSPIYNKWSLNTLDLTAYLTQNIQIEIIASDCTGGAHYGYVYFDAQCSPMVVIGNNSQFPAGSPSITLPTCGASGATITLPNGLGPYSWQGPGVPGSYSVPSFTNQTYITSISGTLNAIMNPPGACAPIIRLITVTITPAPNLNLTPMQPSCSNSVAALTGTLTVGATPMTAVHSGPTGTVPVNVTGNTFSSPGGTVTTLAAGIHTITIIDGVGCNITKTIQINPPLAIPNFSVGSPGADYTLTCINSPITMTTSNAGLTYTWTSPSGTATGNFVNVAIPGTWQVVGQSPVSGCSVAVTFTISQNLTAPTIIITPTVNNITCAGGSGCFTLTSNLGPNVTTNWFQVCGTNTVYVGVPQGTINTFCAGNLGCSTPVGVFWGESVNNLTGCKSTKSVQVTASVGVPVFTVTSPTNFTIGCASTSITSMQVTTVITSPVPNVPVSYTFVPPATTGTPTTFTTNPNQNGIVVPGTWVVWVKDITNNCISSQSISIIQNTIAPNVDFIQPLSLLTCREPSMVLQGISSNSNTTITWTVPAIPSNSVNPTPNHTVNINPAVTSATAVLTSVGTFTVGAVDINNQCRSTKTVQIIQDIRLPKFTISALTNSVINCINADVVIVPIITPTLAVALVPTYTWFPPIGGGVPGTQFNTTACGTHTAESMSAVNGCTTSATFGVACDLTPPAVDFTPVYTLDCGTNQATVQVVVSPTTNLKYYWDAFPAGVFVTDRTKSFILGTEPGEYGVTVTNTVNGCKTTGAYQVVEGTLNTDFIPSVQFGYSPLGVTFLNTSTSSAGTGSMIGTWSYGNGSVLTNTYNSSGNSSVTPNTTYTAAGTYSVLLNVTKGKCKGSKIKIIVVEVPSKLEVPNVFTPNGDKVNDVFRLIAASLLEIEATIFDRWGNKVYEVTSGTGNIGWDGKNMFGKECPSGTYFYMIKAKGKDAQEYDLKGNVTLFR
ncbi:MAG: gliding motility-associated C-terminal domain-containing protein [Sphingobacteriaceae bacterium]|nr:gliding motility-associated C-terminal domain-containing protein [Sphingobacteriaceae bacterium]